MSMIYDVFQPTTTVWSSTVGVPSDFSFNLLSGVLGDEMFSKNNETTEIENAISEVNCSCCWLSSFLSDPPTRGVPDRL